jgi:hypothetical protein
MRSTTEQRMTRHLQPPMQKATRRRMMSQRRRVSIRLPESVVRARAGLIPSEETDSCPPPTWLTAKELLAWHRGLPVTVSYAAAARRHADRTRHPR